MAVCMGLSYRVGGSRKVPRSGALAPIPAGREPIGATRLDWVTHEEPNGNRHHVQRSHDRGGIPVTGVGSSSAVRLHEPLVQAEALVPTRYGRFRFLVFCAPGDPSKDHVALVTGDVAHEQVLVRVHSECITSEVFGSLRCDCAQQLDAALDAIARCGRGILLYLRQEGRGIGLANKVRAYALQQQGLDTVDANRALGLPDDARRYDAAAALLRDLGVRSVRLLTNNPAKIDALRRLGVRVEREPLLVSSHPLSLAYLHAKRSRMNHFPP
jgi:GTP cyclohydrolase II